MEQDNNHNAPQTPGDQTYDEAAAAAAAVQETRTQIHPVRLPSFDSPEPAAAPANSNFDLIQDVPLEIGVEVGRAKRTIRDILALSSGSIIELDKQAGDPVDIIVNGRLLAHGEVVVIDENFGVRITEIVSRSPEDPEL